MSINRVQLSLEEVRQFAQQHRIAITIRPDGSIFGFEEDRIKLASLLALNNQHESGCRCEICRYE